MEVCNADSARRAGHLRAADPNRFDALYAVGYRNCGHCMISPRVIQEVASRIPPESKLVTGFIQADDQLPPEPSPEPKEGPLQKYEAIPYRDLPTAIEQ